MKRLLPVFLLCLVFNPISLLSQSTFVRSLALFSFNSKTAPHPPTGGFIHASVKVVGSTYYPAFLRLDSLGQPVQTMRASIPIAYGVYPTDLARLAGGGYAACYRWDDGSLVFTLDSMGVPVSCHKGTIESRFEEIAPSQDGGFLTVGIWPNQAGQTIAAMAIKFNALGDTLWTRNFEMPGTGLLIYDATALPSGDFILAAQLGDICTLMRLSSSGQLMWTKQYPIASGNELLPKKIIYNNDGQIYLAGYSLNYNHVCAAVFDTLGNFQWGRRSARASNAVLRKIELTPEGDFLLGGDGVEFIGQQTFRFGIAMCFSKSGYINWLHKHAIGNTYYLSDVEPLPGGGYFWTGSSTSQTFLFKTTASDSIAGSCGPVPNDTAATIIVPDTATAYPVVILRNFPSPRAFTTSTFTTSSAILCAAVGVEAALPEKAATVVPQPMHDAARIRLSEGSLADDAQLHISDLSGRSIALPVTRLADGFEVERGGLPAGIYAYQVLQGGQRIASGKLWVAD